MSNDTAPRVQRTLFPNATPSAPPRTEPVGNTIYPPTSLPGARIAPVFASSPATTPRQVPSMTQGLVPGPTQSRHAAPMHDELMQPLSELIPRQTAVEFKKVFEDLVANGVSDVHMTRSGIDGNFTVEGRVDGRMQDVHVYKGSEAQTIATLIRTDAKMTTGPNKVPEDGSYDLPINGYPYRARAVRVPLFDGGERIVFRLPQTGRVRTLDELGFTAKNLAATKGLLDIPGGMTLFVGPTGEGKSTTSLSSLLYLRETLDDGVIMTFEDPVERVMAGMAQVEVNEDLPGAGFGDMMKFVVRSDPNVLFIGEIRDRATATAAVEIAKTGRRVIATMHATDNVSAFMRLVGMVDDTALSVLESVNGVVSQRLVPRLVQGTDRFSGRYPIHEVTTNSDELTDALIKSAARSAIRNAAALTSTTFKETAEELAADGITTLEEVRKAVRNV